MMTEIDVLWLRSYVMSALLQMLFWKTTRSFHYTNCQLYHYNINRLTCNGITLTKLDLMEFQLPPIITELRLIDNNIEEISAEILHNFVNMTLLEISKNKIQSIPYSTFSNFSNLESLKLNGNKIRDINETSFLKLSKLVKLNLEQNQIEILPIFVFSQLSSIQEIRLSNNQIKTVPNEVFNHLTNLRNLFLTHNQISIIGDQAFQNLSFKRVSFSHNRLSGITVAAFKGVKVSFKIAFYFNPLNCSCTNLVDYERNLKHLRNKVLGECEYPYDLRGKHVLTVYSQTSCSSCDVNPCQNGGTCMGNKSSYQCACAEYYNGKHCNVSICGDKMKYVQRVIYRTRKVPLQQEKPEGNVTLDSNKVKTIANEKMNKRLIMMYVICALEFVIIMGFVFYFAWKNYQTRKLYKQYEKQKQQLIIQRMKNRKIVH